MSINCPGGQVYVVKSGDTLYLIARRFNITVASILAVNPGLNPNYLMIGQQICIPVPPTCPGVTYTIKAGDTLFSIARSFNTTVAAIVSANPGIDPNRLMIGQVICIPQGPPPPVPRPRCVVLSPTDLVPNSKGAVFIEPDLGSIVGLVTNVPAPTVLPGGEVYKLWVKAPSLPQYAVTTMAEFTPGYWIARIVPGLPLAGAFILISAEPAAPSTVPQGTGVAVGTI
ncbi:MAG: LysM peptidoglycan-binding domain-containing protein [Eubacteriales bacterium]